VAVHAQQRREIGGHLGLRPAGERQPHDLHRQRGRHRRIARFRKRCLQAEGCIAHAESEIA
jgi:hypothetical protein